jgi:hypothetical protein
MNANMGLLPWDGRVRGSRRVRRDARNQAVSSAAISAMEAWRRDNAWLFPSRDFA